jgi:uncharacterized GH25 family protein
MNTRNAGPFRRLSGVIVMAVAISGATLAAHDMWIEPATFSPDTGQVVGVRLRVGQDLLGDPLPRNPGLIHEFVVQDATGRQPLVGRDGSDPAGFFRIATPGLLIIGYRSNPSAIEQTADKFNQYLKEEGLEAIAALRAQRNQTGAKARELFSRCAKSLLVSGSPSKAQDDRALGFTLELIAERSPYALNAGQEIPVRLIYENRPLAGALVVAMNRLHPSEKLTARTDEAGRASFKLHQNGMWLIKAVHMVEAPAGADADWVSYWASMTFELKDGPGRVS